METIGIVGAILGLYWGHTGIVENNMETNILLLLSFVLPMMRQVALYESASCAGPIQIGTCTLKGGPRESFLVQCKFENRNRKSDNIQ